MRDCFWTACCNCGRPISRSSGIRRRSFQHRPLPCPLAWNAEAGRLSDGLKPVTDAAAVSQSAIEVTPGTAGAGVATYEVDVPVGCAYQLCCRLRTSTPGPSLSARVDNGPLLQCPPVRWARVPPLPAAATAGDERGQAQPDDRPTSAGDEARSARTRPPSDQTRKLIPSTELTLKVIRYRLRYAGGGTRARWTAPGWPANLAEDHQLRPVLLIWALCCVAQALYIKAYGASLPWCDEWWLTATASGHEHLTWAWLWQPANEHRAPLTRLAILVLAGSDHRIGR